MKKIILLFLMFLSISAFSQQEHLKFMGVPLCGSLDECVTKLLQRNGDILASVCQKNDSIYLLKTDFFDINSCDVEVCVFDTKNYNQVASAKIIIEHMFWETRKPNIKKIIDGLIAKYGMYEDVDNDEMLQKIRWTCENGVIEMIKYKLTATCVLEYIDYIKAVGIIKNEANKKKKELDLL